MEKTNSIKNTTFKKQNSNPKIKSNQSASITVHNLELSPNKGIGVRLGIKKLWNIVPLFIKFMSILTIILSILNIFFKSISFYLSNIPYYTIFHIQIWRLISSVLITTNIINVILGLIFWARDGSSMETRLGTLKYIIIFLRNTIIIEILYSLIIYLISLIIRNKDFTLYKINNKGDTRNCGFWPVIMCELTLLCICNPNSRVKFLSIPWEFSAKYYPIIWFVLFCSFNNYNNDIAVFTGVLFAFIYQYGLKYYLNIPDKYIEKMENSCCCKWMLKITGFVTVSHISNKFMDEKLKQRMTGQILNLNKPSNSKKIKSNENNNNIEKNIKTSSEYTNRTETSIISNASPPSIFDSSLDQNKPPNP